MGIGQYQFVFEGWFQVIGEVCWIVFCWQLDGSVGWYEGVVVGCDIGVVGIGVVFFLLGEVDWFVVQQYVVGFLFVEIEGGLQYCYVWCQGVGGEFLVDVQVVEFGEVYCDVQGYVGKVVFEGCF